MDKLLSRWWLRIIIFLFLTSILFLLFNGINLPDFTLISTNLFLLFSLIISSIVIDYFRAGHFPFLFGLYLTNKTLAEVLFPLFINIIFFGILLLGIHLFTEINISINITFWKHSYNFYLLLFLLTSSINEELIFRGILFQSIIDKFGISFSLLITGFFFAFLHLNNPYSNSISFINTILASILLGLMYYNTRTLYMPIVFHFSWNVFSAIFLNSNVSGYEMVDSIFEINYLELNPILFGGKYGIEAGIITTLYLLLMIFLTIKLFFPHPKIQSKLFKRELFESNF